MKATNDIYGHKKGDELIKTFSDMLLHIFDDVKNIYRIGGDEFVLLFSGMSQKKIEEQVEKLKQEVSKKNIQYDIQIYFAMGLAYMDEDAVKDIDSLILCADRRMYENKKKNETEDEKKPEEFPCRCGSGIS